MGHSSKRIRDYSWGRLRRDPTTHVTDVDDNHYSNLAVPLFQAVFPPLPLTKPSTCGIFCGEAPEKPSSSPASWRTANRVVHCARSPVERFRMPECLFIYGLWGLIQNWRGDDLGALYVSTLVCNGRCGGGVLSIHYPWTLGSLGESWAKSVLVKLHNQARGWSSPFTGPEVRPFSYAFHLSPGLQITTGCTFGQLGRE
ncbi:hypothetical protein K474DRAFT_1655287 [Panus rudis PR-1116 ss-1]|nr:hypothetical protein K474DRAFT_1655287 [Panus rudis PR-1116 ss-1]